MKLIWTHHYPATVGEVRTLLAELPADMPVHSYDDFCLEVQIPDGDGDVVFDHGCRVDRGYGPWSDEDDD